MKTLTKGDIIIEDIKIGDIHYEYEHGCCVKCEVVELPILTNNIQGHSAYTWKAKNLTTGSIITYMQSVEYSHYGLNIYSYEAYMGCIFV